MKEKIVAIQDKMDAAIQRRNEGLARVKELKRLIDSIESEIISENLLIEKYKNELIWIEYQKEFS